LSVVDLDANGTLDVAVALGPSQTVAIATGAGDGNFSFVESIQLGATATEIAAADFDENGTGDLAVGTTTEPAKVSVFYAGPAFAFGEPVVVLSDDYGVTTDLDVADLDDDGRADLVATQESGTVGFLRNQGDGTFDDALQYFTGYGSQYTVLSDVNGDDRLDAATANQSGILQEESGIVLLLNILGPFPNVGYPHATSLGFAHLAGSGEPVPGKPVSFSVSGIPAGTIGLLFLGFDFALLPFQGGTLVPSPGVAIPVDSQGPLVGRWPELPIGTAIYAQAWFVISGEIAATNAIVGVTKSRQ
jgi:hypothetical protein